MPWLLAVCVSCLFFCTGALGTLVPLQNPDGIEAGRGDDHRQTVEVYPKIQP